ncbi:MAG TPA: TetR/AcrR family transcriptional regulator [Syntrophorhabdaceae bacterium]|nr:TetR/AcrR family transcriptional regulator [Syntrophorhabdaceae bacterium]HPA07199.1 TetR/AcrR family transcriptional regulator [Methanoregulaceae archaeon]
MSSEKSAKTIWLEQGLKILATQGPAALCIENLTATTGKTKGSFYHHFGSREKYIELLLEYHERTTIDEIIAFVRQENNPGAQLKRLTKLSYQISSDLELVIRAWALYDPMVRKFCDRVDKRRLEHVKNLHISSGLTADEAEVLSYRDYSLFLGLQQLRHHLNNTQLKRVLKGIYSGSL